LFLARNCRGGPDSKILLKEEIYIQDRRKGGNVQKGLAQGMAQENYRAFSQVIRGEFRSSFCKKEGRGLF
jgi:hypothetical protein